MRYLIDTDWLIDLFAAQPGALEWLDRIASDQLVTSIVSVGEFYEGAFLQSDWNHRLEVFREFLADFPLVGLSEPIMVEFAKLRALLRRQGRLIPDADLLIASTALHHDFVLVTRNRRHFDRVPGLALLSPAP
jgi:predicted nucleic acid-binding protein